jgi:hypothetical protein
VNVKNNDGWTALEVAPARTKMLSFSWRSTCAWKARSIVKMMIGINARTQNKNRRRKRSAFDESCWIDNEQKVGLCRERQATPLVVV